MQTKIPFGILVMKFIKIEEIQGKQIIFDESVYTMRKKL